MLERTRPGRCEHESIIPIVGDIKNDAIVGISHHINVPLDNTDYDDLSGLLITRAGQLGVPGALEAAAIALADATGATVAGVPTTAPLLKTSRVRTLRTDHRLRRRRNAGNWEFLPFVHTPMPPVGNLGWYGLQKFGAQPGPNTKFLGFALHAIGDATVPMHVAGAFGWGHRPYEGCKRPASRSARCRPADGAPPGKYDLTASF